MRTLFFNFLKPSKIMEKNALYSETVKGVFRTYFFNFRQSGKGNPYLQVTESHKSKEEEGKFVHQHIVILHKDLGKFAEALNNVIRHHKEKTDAAAG